MRPRRRVMALEKGHTSSVVLDAQGLICAADFSDFAFEEIQGWPRGDLVGKPFVVLHAKHSIPMSVVSRGVQLVCQGRQRDFSFQFEISADGKSYLYHLFAERESPKSDSVVVTYRSIEQSAHFSDNIDNIDLYATMFEHAPMGIVYQNNKGRIEKVNPAGLGILGFSKSQIRKVRKDNLPWECLDAVGTPLPFDQIPSFITLSTGAPQSDRVMGLRRKNGDVIWLQLNSELIIDRDTGQQCGVLTTFVDITRQRQAQEALKAQTERTQMAVESAEMGVWDWVPAERQMLWDKKQFQIYGYPDDGSVSALDVWKKAIHPDDVARVLREADDMNTTGKEKQIDFRIVRPNGRVRNVRTQARLVKNTDGAVTRVIGVTHDITNEVLAEQKLWELAYTDTLTGCYSREGLNYRLSRTVARALSSDSKFAVFMFGLRRFKDINDNYGPSVGDKILSEVATRAQLLVTANDTVARVGGDEFTIVIENADNEAAIEEFTRNFRQEVLKPISLSEGLLVNLDASMGVSVFPEDGSDAPTLQTNASLAMHKDRSREQSSYTRYTPSMTEEVSRRFNLKYQLFSAVKDQEFQLYYQPIIDLGSRDVIGCEALIRWKDNTGKFVSPMEFIPVVEEGGLICELGDWINLTAIKQWKLWQQLVPDLKYISVNVSPRQVENSEFVETLVNMVHAHGIQPENLQLEITEGTFLQESENADGTLHKLAAYGFRLAIDDFGTGYSSLAYLKRFNVDVIKIDRSFIRDIETDESDRDIVSAILAMNKKLGFKTLVEGVETDKQNEIVLELGCDSAQGYLYGRPTFADEFAEVYIQPQSEKSESQFKAS